MTASTDQVTTCATTWRYLAASDRTSSSASLAWASMCVMIRPRTHSASLVSRMAPSTSSTITSRLPRTQPLTSPSGAIAPVNVALPSRDDDFIQNAPRCDAGRTTKGDERPRHHAHCGHPAGAPAYPRRRPAADRSPIPADRRFTPGTSDAGARHGRAAARETARPHAVPRRSGCTSGRQAHRSAPRGHVLLRRSGARGTREADERVPPARDEYHWPVLQSPFHVECLRAACFVTAVYAADVTMRDDGQRMLRPGRRLTGG